MELLAENRFVITKSLFREGMLRIYRDSYGAFARRSMAVLGAIWLALLVFTLVSGGDVAHTLLLLVILGLIGWWLWVYLPRYNARRAFRALEQRSGGEMERITRFYEDRLEIGEEDPTVIGYGEIAKIRQTRHLLILVCENKVGVLLDLQGFTLGNEEKIYALLESAGNKERVSHD